MAVWGGLLALLYMAGLVILPRGVPPEALIPGLVVGGLSSFTAIGLVLIYRSARIVNFAQANIGGFVATLVVLLVTVLHWNYWLAVGFGFVASLLIGVWIERGLLGPIRNAPRIIVTVATIGIAQLLGGLSLYLSGAKLGFNGWYLPNPFTVPNKIDVVVPFHAPLRAHATIGSLFLTSDYFLAIAAIPVVLVALTWYFNRTDSGIGARGAADSAERALLLGIPVRRLSLITWMVACAMSSLGAVLFAGVQGFQSSLLVGPEALVAPLAAAVIAGFDSLTIAVVASVSIGVAQQAIFWSYRQSSLVDLVLFIVVLVALLLRRNTASRVGGEDIGGFIALREPRPLSELARSLPEVRIGTVGGLASILLVTAILPLWFNNSQLTFFAFMAIFMIVAASLVILAGWAGQISLGQFAFVGLGAGMTGWLISSYHVSVLLCLACSTVTGIVTALAIGIPALRIRGVYLAAVTLAFAVPASTFFLSSLHFPSFTPSVVHPPVLFGRFDLSQPRDFYYFCLIFTLLAFGLARNFRNCRIGRASIAVRDNERLAAAVSISAPRVRLVAFGMSGGLAGLAGGLFVLANRGIPFGGFAPGLSLAAFTMVVVGGLGSLWGAVLGALYVYMSQYFLGASAQLLVSGGGIVTILTLAPGGLADLGYRMRDQVLRMVLRRRHLSPNLLYADVDVAPSEPRGPRRKRLAAPKPPGRLRPLRSRHTVAAPAQPGHPLLLCDQVEAGYGHLQILFGASADVASGEVFALLGTNGAGKSTILRVIAGLLPTWGGRVMFDGNDISRLTPAERVRRGVVLVPGGRGVFGTLSVRDNLRLASWIARRHGDKASVADTTAQVFELFPVLQERLDQKASLLSGGEQQMLTIAQALLCRPRLLMIDELSLGLAPVVVGDLLEVVRRLNADGVTIILVEQSMNIAAAVAPRAVFLEKGQVRFSGPTKELASNDALVRSVFLTDPRNRPGARAEGARPTRRPVVARDLLPAEQPGPPLAERPVVLAARSLRKRYGGVTAVDGVDLELYQGEILGVIGANGAGKTTLFDIISGFVRPDSGQLFLDGRDVTRTSAAGRAARGLGRTFQDLRLIPSLPVREAIAVALERHIDVREPTVGVFGVTASLRSEAKVSATVDELVESFHLQRYANTFISDLSTGTRRIVELACATAHQPHVLVLDEPSSGLAQPEAEAMIPLLRDLKTRTGATIAIIEHDIPMIKALSDEIVCMHLGRVIARGSAEAVLSDPMVVASYLGLDEVAVQRSGTLDSPDNGDHRETGPRRQRAKQGVQR